jgi:hypothetical protein
VSAVSAALDDEQRCLLSSLTGRRHGKRQRLRQESALPGGSTARPAPRPQACSKEDEWEPDSSYENDHWPELAQVIIGRLRQRHQTSEDDPRTASKSPAAYQQADSKWQCDEKEQQPQDQEERVHRAADLGHYPSVPLLDEIQHSPRRPCDAG